MSNQQGGRIREYVAAGQCHHADIRSTPSHPARLDSLAAQSLPDWELLIIDDGSRGATGAAACFRRSAHPLRAPASKPGPGPCAQRLPGTRTRPLLAYLPQDGVFFNDHLRDLADCLAASPAAVLAFSGMRHWQAPGCMLQLVQCMHRCTPLRWRTRAETVSDDLEDLFWERLRYGGAFEYSGAVSCERDGQ
ncbi:glycosyltransferase family 2 protein [Massilia sp. B-10]|nr:glycosyltransferase family 2 protein [Massilia sp. B-10]